MSNDLTALSTESGKLAELQEKASNLIQQQQAAEIVTAEDNEKGADLAKLLKTYLKKIEDDRRGITDPLNAVIKNINARYKPTTDALKGAVDALKDKMTEYARIELKRQEEAREAARKAEEEEALLIAENTNDLEEAEKVLSEAADKSQALANKADSVSAVGDFGGSSHTATRLLWTVLDPAAVPREYMSVDAGKVQLHIDAHKAAHRAEGEKLGLKGKSLTNYVNKKTAETVNIPGIDVQADIEVRVR